MSFMVSLDACFAGDGIEGSGVRGSTATLTGCGSAPTMAAMASRGRDYEIY